MLTGYSTAHFEKMGYEFTLTFNLEIIPQRFKESHPAENYRFRSAFAPLLEAFVQDKRDSGFSYDSERKILKYFDLLCVDHEVHRRELSKE